jgi:hypothetical protein
MTPQERLRILYERIRDFRINEDQVLSDCGARKRPASAPYSGLQNERAEHAEALLPIPTELVPLKPAAFNADANYETARGRNLQHRVGDRRLEAVSKLVVRCVVHRAAPWPLPDRACRSLR